MTENATPTVGDTSAPGGDPHLHCWHWKPVLVDARHAEAVCCFDGVSVTVGTEHPVLRGEHGEHGV